MKTKKTLPLIAMLAAGSMLCLSGCNTDVTTINEEEVPVEEAVEEENLAEGMVLFHSVWYDAEGDKLPDADVAFYDDDTLSFSGTTDENGELEACSLPCNTTLFCSVTDEAGNPIAESNVVIKLSDNYESIAIYPTRDVESEEETPTLTIEIPTDNVNLRAAFYVTQSETVSLASLTPYVEETEEAVEEETEEAAEEAAEEQTAGEQPAGEQAAEEQPAEQQQAEEQTAEEQPAEQQQAEEQTAEEQPAEQQQAGEQTAEEQPAEQQQAEQQNAEQQQAEQQPAAE